MHVTVILVSVSSKRALGPIGQLETAAAPVEGMTARWSDPHRLPVPPTGDVRAVNAAGAR